MYPRRWMCQGPARLMTRRIRLLALAAASASSPNVSSTPPGLRRPPTEAEPIGVDRRRSEIARRGVWLEYRRWADLLRCSSSTSGILGQRQPRGRSSSPSSSLWLIAGATSSSPSSYPLHRTSDAFKHAWIESRTGRLTTIPNDPGRGHAISRRSRVGALRDRGAREHRRSRRGGRRMGGPGRRLLDDRRRRSSA